MSGKDSNIKTSKVPKKKLAVKQEKLNTRGHEYNNLKKDVDRGCKKFWAKRGAQGYGSGFNYGQKGINTP